MLTDEMKYSPEFAIALLEELQEYGFTDKAFKVIHHFGKKATIQSHDGYCRKKVASFQDDGNNERVCRRLVLVRNAFKAGPFAAPANPGVFEALGTAALNEIPT